MTFEFDPEVVDYMKNTGKTTMVVEVVTSDNSDFEVSELYIHPVDPKKAETFRKKRYRAVPAPDPDLTILLPPFKLDYSEIVRFHLRKILFVTSIKYEGIRLIR